MEDGSKSGREDGHATAEWSREGDSLVSAGCATVLVTGYAPAPKGTAMHTVYQYAGIVLEVDPKTDIILRADITALTGLAKDFCNRLLSGQSMQDTEKLVSLMRQRYLAPSIEALIMALRSAAQRYADHKHPPEGVSCSKRPRLKLKVAKP